MQAVIFAAMAAASLGVDVGWQPAPDGGLEYIIQIEPETLAQLRAGQELAVGIRPELRDVRRYRIIVGDGPLPREALRPQAAEFGTESDVGAAAPAVATERVSPYRTPTNETHTAAARPDLLAQANTTAADPLNSRYGGNSTRRAAASTTVPAPATTPRFNTPSRYNGSTAVAGTPTLASPAPSTPLTTTPVATTTSPQAYDWFSERFGGAGSINVPLLYTTTENTNPVRPTNSTEGWSSANGTGGTTGYTNNTNEAPIRGLPNPPNTEPRLTTATPFTNPNDTKRFVNPGNNTAPNYNNPRYANNTPNNSGNYQANNASNGPRLNPPNDTNLPPVNRNNNGGYANNGYNNSGRNNNAYNNNGNQNPPTNNTGWPQGNATGGYARPNNSGFPVAPTPRAPQQNPAGNPFMAGNPYAPGNQNSHQNNGAPRGVQQPGATFPTFVSNGNGGTAAPATPGGALPTFGQGTALDPNNPANAPQSDKPTEAEAKPWGFLMMTLFGLFASMGLNLYLGWNFYDARLRYLDLLDSLRRRGMTRGSSVTSGRVGASNLDVADRYSAA